MSESLGSQSFLLYLTLGLIVKYVERKTKCVSIEKKKIYSCSLLKEIITIQD